MKTEALVYADDELLNENGSMLLCSIANGRYYGGSFMCAPLAENDDGLLEVCLVKPLSRVKFATMVKAYENGEHLSDPRFAEYVVYRRCKKVQLQGSEGFAVTIDGELVEGTEFTCEIIKGGIKFAAPDYKPE